MAQTPDKNTNRDVRVKMEAIPRTSNPVRAQLLTQITAPNYYYFTTYYMCDPHIVIIHDRGKVICREAIGLV